ncbi:helix-turn-helix transcriptional regulator [Streptomyces sp. NBC_01808]|uniref:helix-turn-helix domain-containing protein n=1 Tax=Streptomyces sp. NBC_01808 TaxID=2975947 RepID=UPI002DD8EF91|nr:helix-turn-helix transcriptional regulator [Streptomyces sp. NBC_01808]WSA37733.1 helix-turn-helix transcriptional regulator [Streptomyces sp. NBC_01808]
MKQTRRPDPYDSPRTFYGAELRRLREDAGFSQERLSERVFCSPAYIAHFESCVRLPQEEISKLLDDLFGTGEHLQRLCLLARRSSYPDYFTDAADLETVATHLHDHAPLLVPGLLQTRDYARALNRATQPLARDEAIEVRVQRRMERQRLLENPDQPAVWTVLHEAVLRTPFGGPTVMADQLRHIVSLARSHRIIVQVLPFAAAAHTFMNGMARIMTFAEGPSMVYVESAYSGALIDDPALVRNYRASYDLVRAAALSPTASLELMESVAEDYGRS